MKRAPVIVDFSKPKPLADAGRRAGWGSGTADAPWAALIRRTHVMPDLKKALHDIASEDASRRMIGEADLRRIPANDGSRRASARAGVVAQSLREYAREAGLPAHLIGSPGSLSRSVHEASIRGHRRKVSTDMGLLIAALHPGPWKTVAMAQQRIVVGERPFRAEQAKAFAHLWDVAEERWS